MKKLTLFDKLFNTVLGQSAFIGGKKSMIVVDNGLDYNGEPVREDVKHFPIRARY